MITEFSFQIILKVMTKSHNLPRYGLHNLQENDLLTIIGIRK